MTAEPVAESPAHLTAALRQAGVLGDGQVRTAEIESARDTVLSRLIRLKLEFDGDASGAPTRLILKTGIAGRDAPSWQTGSGEVGFYNTVAPAMPPGLLPRCFEATLEPATRAWHLLLEDLGETHDVCGPWPLPPGEAQCAAIVRAWARFHAAWWDDPRLGVEIGERADAMPAERRQRDFTARFATFVDKHGDGLTPRRRALYEDFIAATPKLMARTMSHRRLTLVHGDAHAWNCLLPRVGGDDVRLFDWDSWHVDIAAFDLAYLMAMHWYPDRRARLEAPLLDRYHAALLAGGVTGYDRAALADDYRLAVLWLLRRPVTQAVNGIPPVIWWNNLERILLAVDDLDCRALLD